MYLSYSSPVDLISYLILFNEINFLNVTIVKIDIYV